jgi:DNA-binding IclR family transcriptional regulator
VDDEEPLRNGVPVQGSRSLDRALRILEYLSSRPEGARRQRIAHDLGINPETLRPYLTTLKEWGRIFHSEDDDRFHLDPERIPLQTTVASTEDIQVFLKGFVDRTGHDVALVVLGADGLAVTHYCPASRDESLLEDLRPDAAHATAAGHALLWQRNDAYLRRYFNRVGMPRFTRHTPVTIEQLKPKLDPEPGWVWAAKGQYCDAGACIAVLARNSKYTAERIALTTSVRVAQYHRQRVFLEDHLKLTAGRLEPVLGPLLPSALQS